MGFRRCESASACVGGMAGLQDRTKRTRQGRSRFLERVFHKLLLNFTWWVNRKDAEGKKFSRADSWGWTTSASSTAASHCPPAAILNSRTAPAGWQCTRSNMLAIAMELAARRPDLRRRGQQILGAFPVHRARHEPPGRRWTELWNEEDGFFYDVLHSSGRRRSPLKVRSMVGLIPLYAVTESEPGTAGSLPGFKRRLEWFIDNRPISPATGVHAHAGP